MCNSDGITQPKPAILEVSHILSTPLSHVYVMLCQQTQLCHLTAHTAVDMQQTAWIPSQREWITLESTSPTESELWPLPLSSQHDQIWSSILHLSPVEALPSHTLHRLIERDSRPAVGWTWRWTCSLDWWWDCCLWWEQVSAPHLNSRVFAHTLVLPHQWGGTVSTAADTDRHTHHSPAHPTD